MKEFAADSGLSLLDLLGMIGCLISGICLVLSFIIVHIFDAAFYEESTKRNFWLMSDATIGGLGMRAFLYSLSTVSETSAQKHYGVSRNEFRKKANGIVVACCWCNIMAFYSGMGLTLGGLVLPAFLRSVSSTVLIFVSIILAIECFAFFWIGRVFDPTWQGQEVDPEILLKRLSVSDLNYIRRVSRYLRAATSKSFAQKTYGVSREKFLSEVSWFTVFICRISLIGGYLLGGACVWFTVLEIWN